VPTPTPTSWIFDVDRKMDSFTKPGGVSISYGYDGTGRRTSVTFPGGAITRGYSPTTGKLTSVTGPAGMTLTYGYDGNLLTDMTWSGSIAGTVHRVFNNDLRVSSETVNGAGAVSFGYDNDGLLTSTGGLTLTRSTQNGRLDGTTLGSVSETVTYNSFGEIEQRNVSTVLRQGARDIYEGKGVVSAAVREGRARPSALGRVEGSPSPIDASTAGTTAS
jgi:YD repeat-containing protein